MDLAISRQCSCYPIHLLLLSRGRSTYIHILFSYFAYHILQTTGKSLEDIDLLFATSEVRERILASQMWQHPENEKSGVIGEEEEIETV